MAGKYFYFSQDIRLHSRLGLAGNFIEAAENYYLITKSCRGMGICLFSGTYHEYDYRHSFNAGLLINQNFDIARARKFGFRLGARTNINNKQTIIAGEAGLVFGIGGAKGAF